MESRQTLETLVFAKAKKTFFLSLIINADKVWKDKEMARRYLQWCRHPQRLQLQARMASWGSGINKGQKYSGHQLTPETFLSSNLLFPVGVFPTSQRLAANVDVVATGWSLKRIATMCYSVRWATEVKYCSEPQLYSCNPINLLPMACPDQIFRSRCHFLGI